MIAMTISLLLLSGLYSVFLANRATYGMQQGLSRLQENGRYAMQTLTRNVRMAGYAGCGRLGQMVLGMDAADPPAAADLGPDTAVGGRDSVAAGNSYGAKAGTDVVSVRYLSPNTASLAADMKKSKDKLDIFPNRASFNSGDLLVISDCVSGDVFVATNVDGKRKDKTVTLAHRRRGRGGKGGEDGEEDGEGDRSRGGRGGGGGTFGNLTDDLSKAYTAGARVSTLVADTFFVAATGRSNDRGQPILALYRRTINGARQELVDNVTDMQVLYGQDTDNDGVANAYLTADAVSNWPQIVSLRIALLFQSGDPVASDLDTRTFALLDQDAGPFNDRYLRRVLTTTIALRNRLP